MGTDFFKWLRNGCPHRDVDGSNGWVHTARACHTQYALGILHVLARIRRECTAPGDPTYPSEPRKGRAHTCCRYGTWCWRGRGWSVGAAGKLPKSFESLGVGTVEEVHLNHRQPNAHKPKEDPNIGHRVSEDSTPRRFGLHSHPHGGAGSVMEDDALQLVPVLRRRIRHE